MFAALLPWLLNPKTWLYGAIAIGALVLGLKVMSFINEKAELEAQVSQLTTQVSALEEQIQTEKFLKEQAKIAVDIAEAARMEAEARAENLAQVRTRVIRSGGNDEAVPPSLRATLNELRGLQSPAPVNSN